MGLYHLGMPAGVWWKAFLVLLALQQLCRMVPPAAAGNVNLSTRVPDGWESSFPSYGWYWLMMAAIFLASYFLLGLILRRLFPS